MTKKVLVFVGTQKGGFIFSSDTKRKKWQVSDIHFKSWNVMHMQLDRRDQRLHAATSHFVYGPTTHYSDDFGGTEKGKANHEGCWRKDDVNGMSSVLIYFPEIDSTAVYNPQLFSPRSTL